MQFKQHLTEQFARVGQGTRQPADQTTVLRRTDFTAPNLIIFRDFLIFPALYNFT
jgi:hypothetical protein